MASAVSPEFLAAFRQAFALAAGVAALGFAATENAYYIYTYGFEQGGWSGLLIGFFLSTVLLWHGTFTINSLMHLFGRANWWLPGWLDRWLPTLHIESEPAAVP